MVGRTTEIEHSNKLPLVNFISTRQKFLLRTTGLIITKLYFGFVVSDWTLLDTNFVLVWTVQFEINSKA